MKIEYDPEANALYITLREARIAETAEVTESLAVDLGEDGRPIGIEILDVRELLGPEGLGKVTLENLLTDAVIPGG